MVWRVVWGLLEVMATLSPTRALVSVDFPALGRPTRQANPARYAEGSDGGSTAPGGVGSARGWPAACSGTGWSSWDALTRCPPAPVSRRWWRRSPLRLPAPRARPGAPAGSPPVVGDR